VPLRYGLIQSDNAQADAFQTVAEYHQKRLAEAEARKEQAAKVVSIGWPVIHVIAGAIVRGNRKPLKEQKAIRRKKRERPFPAAPLGPPLPVSNRVSLFYVRGNRDH
jgi:hypothetical protein